MLILYTLIEKITTAGGFAAFRIKGRIYPQFVENSCKTSQKSV